jgi:EmrB/QacA subfamily drug resistance transporter
MGGRGLLDRKRKRIVFSVMMATFLTAVDATIVDTAMPRIVGALGGFSLLTWLVTAYLLTSTATVPVYGKLADIIGRKRTFTIGALIFLLGSALCGMAQSMVQLILFRGLQGLGAGAILPVVQTIIGDIFTPAERARIQGWFSSVWGLSALIGPLAGGFIVDHVSWRWLFFINLPLGAMALFMLHVNLQEEVRRRETPVDYLGSALLTTGVTALLLALLEGGTHLPWDSPLILSLLGGAALLIGLFIAHERHHPDPMLPLDLFRIRAIGVANLTNLMIGGVFYGTTVYLPLWAQGVQGYSATRSGASLLWLSIGWPLASIVGGRFILKVGQRPAVLLGLALNGLAAAALLVLGRLPGGIPEVGFGIVTFLIGSGMGFATLALILGVQAAVGWERRGVATASLQFIRTLGGLVWVAAMGAVMNLTLAARLKDLPGLQVKTAAEAGAFANNLLDPALRSGLDPALLTAAREALAEALRGVHWVMLGAALACLAVSLLLPNQRFEGQAARSEPGPAH